MRYLLIIIVFLNLTALPAQNEAKSLLPAINELRDFVAIPNFGLDRDDILKNVDWLEKAFAKRAFTTTVLDTEGNPLFLAEKSFGANLPTVLFYMHLDGQAVDKSKWDQNNPYDLVLKAKDKTLAEADENGDWQELNWADLDGKIDRDWRLFGRSVSDDKGPIVAFLQAMDLLEKNGERPVFNIKVILDGEEEIGSKSLAGAVKKHRAKLAADVLIINDGPVHSTGLPTLTFGCRGITTINLSVYGPVLPQHSGHYGNYAPNPVFRMAALLSSMKDEEGRVLVDGYYDGITLDAATKKILAQVPDDEAAIQDLLQIAAPEKVGNNYQESLQYPSLNVRGIASAWVGAQARTVVPHVATAAIDMRLVPESDPQKLVAALKAHIEAQGFHIVYQEPTYEERKKYPKLLYFNHSKSTLPFRTDMDHPMGQWIEKALTNTFDKAPIKIRIMGGTVPIAAFINELNLPAIIVPMVNPDNNQHSPNENLRIGHLENAIKTFRGILTTKL